MFLFYRIKQWLLMMLLNTTPDVFVGYNPKLDATRHQIVKFVVKTKQNELTLIQFYLKNPQYLTWKNETVLNELRTTIQAFDLIPLRLSFTYKGRSYTYRLTLV